MNLLTKQYKYQLLYARYKMVKQYSASVQLIMLLPPTCQGVSTPFVSQFSYFCTKYF